MARNSCCFCLSSASISSPSSSPSPGCRIPKLHNKQTLSILNIQKYTHHHYILSFSLLESRHSQPPFQKQGFCHANSILPIFIINFIRHFYIRLSLGWEFSVCRWKYFFNQPNLASRFMHKCTNQVAWRAYSACTHMVRHFWCTHRANRELSNSSPIVTPI